MFAKRRFNVVMTLLPFTVPVSACDEVYDLSEGVVGVQLSIENAELVKVTNTGSASVTIFQGASHVNAVFLGADGRSVPVSPGEHELRLVSENAARVTFAGTGFGGTMTGLSAGSTTVQVSVYHLQEQQNVFGPRPMIVTVR